MFGITLVNRFRESLVICVFLLLTIHGFSDDVAAGEPAFSNLFEGTNGCVYLYGSLEFSMRPREFLIEDCVSSWRVLKTFDGRGHISRLQFVSSRRAWGVVSGSLSAFSFDENEISMLIVRRPLDDFYLNDVYFVDPSVGFACGRQGVILKTNNGGKTWKELRVDAGIELKTIRFIDTQFGWALIGKVDVPDKSRGFFVTYDGGETWTPKLLPNGRVFSSASFGSRSNGCGISNLGDVLCTANGSEWEVSRIPSEHRKSIVVDKSGVGWIVGASISRTLNFGLSWQFSLRDPDESNRQFAGLNLDGVYFRNETDGWAWGAASVYRTQDGGATWIKVSDQWLKELISENSKR